MPDPIIQLDDRKLIRIDATADLIADFGHESYYELYERFKHLADMHVFVTKLEPAEDILLRIGDRLAFGPSLAIYEVIDLLKDHTSGELEGVSPGRLAILQQVRGGEGEGPAGVDMEFLAAEPDEAERGQGA
jgi:hypothetical protein